MVLAILGAPAKLLLPAFDPRPDEGTVADIFVDDVLAGMNDNNGWMSSSRILTAMSLEYLDWDLQGSERSPKWYCAIEDLSEPEQCRLRIETNDNGRGTNRLNAWRFTRQTCGTF